MSEIKSLNSAIDLNGDKGEIHTLNDVKLARHTKSISINGSWNNDPMIIYEPNFMSFIESRERKQKPDGGKLSKISTNSARARNQKKASTENTQDNPAIPEQSRHP